MARDGGIWGGRARVSILRRAAAFATERGVFERGVFVSIGDAIDVRATRIEARVPRARRNARECVDAPL